MKGLSDWQSARVRDALRAYHRYERGAEGEFFTWKDVREAISFYVDVEIGNNVKHGTELLRKFVEGVQTKSGDRKFHAPKPAALEAIVAFVLHEELNLLTKDELEEFTPGFQAPIRLLEFLDQKFDKERLFPPAALEGSYRSPFEYNEDELKVRELKLQRPMDSGLIQVMETEDFYDGVITESKFPDLPSSVREKSLRIRHNYGGWAILTPESNLLFFMKEARHGMNRYYFTLGSDLTNREACRYVSFLILLRHDYPIEPEKGKTQIDTEMIRDITAEIPERILSFMRVY